MSDASHRHCLNCKQPEYACGCSKWLSDGPLILLIARAERIVDVVEETNLLHSSGKEVQKLREAIEGANEYYR